VHRFIACILVSVTAVALSPTSVQAGSFSVSPLRVDFSTVAQTGALTIRSFQDSDVIVEAHAMLWEQVDGKDQLSPTRDVLVSPVVFTLPANGSQLVRVALQRPLDVQRELSYRLILSEVPRATDPDFSGLNVALRISLPVFVTATNAAPAIEWTATRNGDALDLTARNVGLAHARVLNLAVAPVDGPDGVALHAQNAAYILPNEARTWPLDVGSQAGSSASDWRRLRVKGATDDGDFDLEIDANDG
jgi:fimbrial chaperone protein